MDFFSNLIFVFQGNAEQDSIYMPVAEKCRCSYILTLILRKIKRVLKNQFRFSFLDGADKLLLSFGLWLVLGHA